MLQKIIILPKVCLRFSLILRLLVRHISIQTSFKNYAFVLT